MDTKLINPRGRLVIVDERDVRVYLSRGFVYPPDDQNRGYNPIYDKGGDEKERALPPKDIGGDHIVGSQRLGDILEVEEV